MTKSTEASFLGQSDEMSREAGDIIDLLDEIILNATCYICPNKSEKHWKEMKEKYPEDWKKAKALEDELRKNDPEVYLHKQGVPLDEVDYDDAQDDMFDGRCDTGHCFV